MAFRSTCPACQHQGIYDLKNSLQQTEERWQLFCERCGDSLLQLSSAEKEQVEEGIRQTEKYVPDVLGAYEKLQAHALPSRVVFGAIATQKKKTEDEA